MFNLGSLSILLAAAIFGTGGWFVKTLALPSPAIVAFRLFVPAVILLATGREMRRRFFTKPSKILILASSVTALRILCWVLALRYSSMSKVIFILYTWPVIFALLNSYYLNERVTRRGKLLLGTGFCGALVILSGERLDVHNNDLVGMGLMMVVAVLNASVMTIFKRELAKYSPQEIVMYDCVVGGLLFLPFLIYHHDALSFEAASWGVVYGVMIGLVAYWLLYYGLARVPAVIASVLCYTEVISATVLGVFLFGEQLTWRVVVGGALIVVAALGAQVTNKRSRDTGVGLEGLEKVGDG